jgi:hypothetical protein
MSFPALASSRRPSRQSLFWRPRLTATAPKYLHRQSSTGGPLRLGKWDCAVFVRGHLLGETDRGTRVIGRGKLDRTPLSAAQGKRLPPGRTLRFADRRGDRLAGGKGCDRRTSSERSRGMSGRR